MNFSAQDNQQDETGIELTPLIDVVFLLLIFFMISTTFTKETSMKINLPEANEAIQEQIKPKHIEIHVGANADYAIAAEGPAQALINSNRETLVKALRKLNTQENLLLVIRADKKAPHEAVIKVLDVAQQVGMTNVTFATKKTEQ